MDNKSKKKADGKRIALTQKHERDYIKRIAVNQLELLKKQRGQRIWGVSDNLGTFPDKCSKAQLIRIVKACLKLMKAYEGKRK